MESGPAAMPTGGYAITTDESTVPVLEETDRLLVGSLSTAGVRLEAPNISPSAPQPVERHVAPLRRSGEPRSDVVRP
ncbi:hypothetical protein BN12_280021 [Nostocoides japonicum T1-X7]|uniref:Uncharacterized protein n=1 Tax=Nostocoides japonicum T1-X7 TaxID=1194083 RepID=A0A077M2A9_9MICO|nr:hypothetical protein BN12_280021 [Tetrasphaera japonica T1-X7]